ncbi:TetR/AcrR family transcriptional regulator [Lacinutrix sp.]|uniref:TetR/AcrR family transcriptional regulator n=1 Tax=Lacinutrix sp. TaxID=1937692 RepID=UPI0025C0E882|nr:TetR/AcrR family transcriptional regulator [Lacinutrix sp.]
MKHSQVRHTIIETASDLFYKNGYNSTGINEIIAEAGIAKATLYNHFKSKEAICISYLQHKNDSFLESVKIYCESKPKGKQQLLALFNFLELFYKQPEFNGCWCIKTIAEIPQDNISIRTEIQKEKKTFIALIQELVIANTTLQSEKEIIVLTKQIYLLYESAVTESHLHKESWPIQAAKSLCNKILI